MVIIDSYPVAVLMCIITMICWGSWANMMKLTPGWPFQLFYWDYVLGVLLVSLLLGLTMGSTGGPAAMMVAVWCCAATISSSTAGTAPTAIEGR